MNINEFPQQVNQVISIAETILQGQILGIYLENVRHTPCYTSFLQRIQAKAR